ncbi:MAG: hypothetical protein AAGH60_01850 [Pseudomonadota bacterium]
MARRFSRQTSIAQHWRAAVLSLGVSCVTLCSGALAQEVGVSAAVRGDVSVNAESATSGQDIFLGDRIISQVSSGMQVLLLDESVFTIGENNDLVIDRFIYDPDQSVGEIAARASQGFLRFVSGGVGRVAPQNIELNTPSATLGVRGTSVDVVLGQAAIDLASQLGQTAQFSCLDPASAALIVLRGPSVSFLGLTQRGRVIVSTSVGTVAIRRQGFGVFVPCPGFAPSATFAVSPVVSDAIITSIEIPSAGVTSAVPGVDITSLPGIDPIAEPETDGSVDPDPSFDLPDIIEEILGDMGPEPSDPEPSDPEPSDPEPSDPEPSDPEPSDPEPSDPEPSDPEPSDPEPSDPEPSDPEPSDPEPSDPEPSDPDPSDPGPNGDGMDTGDGLDPGNNGLDINSGPSPFTGDPATGGNGFLQD